MANALNKVKTSGVEDDAISLAKMAPGTDGQVITYDASGNPTAVGPGTDGQVLTSTGAGSPPAFENLPASGAALTGSTNNTITTVTGANSIQGEANLTFDGTSLNVTGNSNIINSGGNAKLTLRRSNTASNTDDYGTIRFQSSAEDNNIVIGGARQSAENDGYLFISTSSSGTTSERFRIDSSGNVGIGTTPETDGQANSLYFANGNANIWGSGNVNLYTVVNARYTGGSGWKYNNTATASYVAQQSGVWSFHTAASGTADATATFSEKVRIQAAGGISFNGDTAAANALDDYEEGTFDGKFVTDSGTLPTQTVVGHYVKIGKRVDIHCQIAFSGSSGSGSGSVWVVLPFTCANARGGMAMGLVSGPTWSSGHQLFLVPEISSTACYLLEVQPDSAGHTHLGPGNFPLGASNLFSYGGSYITS